MGVLDGQSVNASVTNTAFLNKNNNESMSNILAFNRALSGATISDIQAAVNKLYTATGASESQTGTVYNATAGTITNGQSYQTALTILADKFDAATGHMHTGAAGDGPILNVVRTIAATGYTAAYGDFIFIPSTLMNITQVGTDITFAVTSPVPIVNGGTGATTKYDAFNALSPITTTGDLIYGAGTNISDRLAIGSNNKSLVSNGTIPGWSLLTNSNLSGSAAISNANLATMASSSTTVGTVKGNISGSSATPSDIVLTSANTVSSVVYRDGSGNFSAGTITATFSGTATNATNVATTQVSSNASYFPLMVASSTNGNQAVDLSTGWTFNPSTNILSTTGINLSGLTASQAVVTDSSKNLASLAYTNAATASTLVERDSNANTRMNNVIENFTTTATAGTTTTLTVSSSKVQQFTGSTTQTCKLPDATTLVVGQSFTILNRSSGTVTVVDNGSNTIQGMAASTQTTVTVTNVSTANGVWDTAYSTAGAGSGTVTSVTFTGDGTVLSSTPSSAVTTSGTLTAALATHSANTVLAGPTSGGAATPTFRALVAADFVAPKITVYNSGSGNHTLTGTPRYVKVKMVGSGGSGAGGGTSGNNGTAGNNSTFGTLTANGGAAGLFNNGNGGAGGSYTIGAGWSGFGILGGFGNAGMANGTAASYCTGGSGGNSMFGGGGTGQLANGTTTTAAPANTGGGGGGGGSNNTTGANGGNGGGAGGGVEAIYVSPTNAQVFAYAVGASVSGGTSIANGAAGGNSGSGVIIVEEYYQ